MDYDPQEDPDMIDFEDVEYEDSVSFDDVDESNYDPYLGQDTPFGEDLDGGSDWYEGE